MDTVDIRAMQNKLDQAKFLMMDTDGCKFFANMLMQTKISIDPFAKTAWTDSTQMGFGPEFVQKCNAQELMGTLLHEVYHDILEHVIIGVEQRLDMDVHNEATDHYINLTLEKLGFKLPHFINYYADPQYEGMSSMQIYHAILREKEKGGRGGKLSPSQGGGFGVDIKIPQKAEDDRGRKTPEEIAEAMREQAQNKLIKAVQRTQMDGGIGYIPADIMEAYEALVSPRLPWWVILSNYMTAFCKDDWSFRRPARWGLAHGLYLPTAHSEHIGELHIGIDVSGSMSDDELGAIVGECEHIRQRLRPTKMHVMSFDTKVHECGYVPAYKPFPDIELKGGGGTDVQPCLDLIAKKNPAVALIFTDGGFHTPNLDGLGKTEIFWVLTDEPYCELPGRQIMLR